MPGDKLRILICSLNTQCPIDRQKQLGRSPFKEKIVKQIQTFDSLLPVREVDDFVSHTSSFAQTDNPRKQVWLIECFHIYPGTFFLSYAAPTIMLCLQMANCISRPQMKTCHNPARLTFFSYSTIQKSKHKAFFLSIKWLGIEFLPGINYTCDVLIDWFSYFQLRKLTF